MPWARLDDDFHSHPKLLAVGLPGTGLYARAIAYCAAYLTDGHVPERWVIAQLVDPAEATLPAELEAAGLWQRENGGYRIPDFLQFNLSKAQSEADRERKRAAGRAGAKARWKRD